MGGERLERQTIEPEGIETAEVSLEEEKRESRWQTQEEIKALREALNENPSQDRITVVFDLGDYKKEPALRKAISDKETSVLQINASVDKAPHRSRSRRLPEYVKNAKLIDKYSKHFSPQTKDFYNKNKAIIDEMAKLNEADKNLHNSSDWTDILNKYGDSVTSGDGAMNFILAFMRGTDDVFLRKIDKGEIGENFNINLTIQTSKRELNRSAVFEVKLPKGAEITNKEVNLNMGLLQEVENIAMFWDNSPPDRFAILFAERSSAFQKMYTDLTNLKRTNPDIFNFYPKYQKALEICTKNLIKYYSTFGAVLSNADAKLKEYTKELDLELPSSIDPARAWRSSAVLKWLNQDNFSTKFIDANSRNLLLNRKDGHLRLLYNKIFVAGRVSQENKKLFELLTKIFIEFEEENPDRASEIKIRQYRLNFENLR